MHEEPYISSTARQSCLLGHRPAEQLEVKGTKVAHRRLQPCPPPADRPPILRAHSNVLSHAQGLDNTALVWPGSAGPTWACVPSTPQQLTPCTSPTGV